MPTADLRAPEPLSEAFLATVEQHYSNPSSDMRRLVAEVRRLRYEALVAAEENALHYSEFALQEAEVRSLRTVLSDLLLTRQAREEEWKRYVDDEGASDGALDWEAAYDRLMEVDQAHEAVWDRARSFADPHERREGEGGR